MMDESASKEGRHARLFHELVHFVRENLTETATRRVENIYRDDYSGLKPRNANTG